MTGMQVYLANPRGSARAWTVPSKLSNARLSVTAHHLCPARSGAHRFVSMTWQQGRGVCRRADQVPSGATVIFSPMAFPARTEEAAKRELGVFDATCPLVTKVHMEVVRHRNNGTECILIGHAGHPKVEGTMGQADTDMHLSVGRRRRRVEG